MSHKFHGHKDFLAAVSEAECGAAATRRFTIKDAMDGSSWPFCVQAEQERSIAAVVHCASLECMLSAAQDEKLSHQRKIPSNARSYWTVNYFFLFL